MLTLAVPQGVAAEATLVCRASGDYETAVAGGTSIQPRQGAEGATFVVPVSTGLNTLKVRFTNRNPASKLPRSIDWSLSFTAWVYTIEPWGRLELPPIPGTPEELSLYAALMDAAGNLYMRLHALDRATGTQRTAVARFAPGGKLGVTYEVTPQGPWADGFAEPRCLLRADGSGNLFLQIAANILQFGPSGKFTRSLGVLGAAPWLVTSLRDLDFKTSTRTPAGKSPFSAIGDFQYCGTSEKATLDGKNVFLLGNDARTIGQSDQTRQLVRLSPAGTITVLAAVSGPGTKYAQALSLAAGPDGNLLAGVWDASRNPSLVTYTPEGKFVGETAIPEPHKSMLSRVLGIDREGAFYGDFGARVSKDFSLRGAGLRDLRYRTEWLRRAGGQDTVTDLLTNTPLATGARPADGSAVWFTRGSLYVLYKDRQVAKYTLATTGKTPNAEPPAQDVDTVDTGAPLAWAVAPAAPVKRGRIELHFRGKSNSGKAEFRVFVYEHGDDISDTQPYRLQLPLVAATGEEDHKVLFEIGPTVIGPLYFCVVATDANGTSPQLENSCAWIPFVVPVEDPRVSNGCGTVDWGGAGTVAQNFFIDERWYWGAPGDTGGLRPTPTDVDVFRGAPGDTGEPRSDTSNVEWFPVNFRDACNIHDAGYAGLMVEDKLHGNAIVDFRTWSRQQVDDKFHADLRLICERDIKNNSRKALEACLGGGGKDAAVGDYFTAVRMYGGAGFDTDLTKPRGSSPSASSSGGASTGLADMTFSKSVFATGKRDPSPWDEQKTLLPSEIRGAMTNAPPAPAQQTKAPAVKPAPPAAAPAPQKEVQDVLDSVNKLKDVFRGLLR